MLKRKLSKHGNSRSIVIDKPILELLGWSEDQEVQIETTRKGTALIISPVPRSPLPNKSMLKKYPGLSR